jgi:hypothetical protein
MKYAEPRKNNEIAHLDLSSKRRVGSSNLPGRAIFSITYNWRRWPSLLAVAGSVAGSGRIRIVPRDKKHGRGREDGPGSLGTIAVSAPSQQGPVVVQFEK